MQLKRRDTSSARCWARAFGLQALKSQLDKVTKSNGRVLLTGPAGCGKEVAARFIHANSDPRGCAVCVGELRRDRA